MLSDLRFAFRQMAKAPGFTAIIVLTLALSIGACTAIYTALDRIVLHPFDDPETRRNVSLLSIKLPQRTEGGLSFPDFLDLVNKATSFELIAHHTSNNVNLTGSGEPLRVRRELSTPDYFDVVGMKMALGRAFRPDEFVMGKNNVVVLTYGFWHRAFGGAPDILGRILQINEQPCTVIGVTSKRFERSGGVTELFGPWALDAPPDASLRAPRSSRTYAVFTTARLRRGVTIKQAQAELDVIAAALAEKYPETNKNFGMLADTVMPALRRVASPIPVLFAAVGCLMLIACANVATLLLLRAHARQREMAVRAALGATRPRLIRQMLTENFLMALLGGTVGIVLALWAIDFIASCVPTGPLNRLAAGGTGLSRLAHLEIDHGVVLFVLGLSIATALIFGLVPTWLSSSPDLIEAIKQGARGSTEGRARGRFRATLVVLEVAMAMTLLACSALLIRSFVKLAHCDLGFDPKGAAFANLALTGASYAKPEQQIAFINALLPRIQSAPGVEAVGTINFFPLSGSWRQAAGFEIEGGPTMTVAERPLTHYFSVSPDYFRAMGIPLKEGRYFSEHDDAKTRRVAIINQTLARQYFPNQSPIGKRITIPNPSDEWREIVGVVGDVAQADVGELPPAQFYEPHAQKAQFAIVVARGPGNPALLPAIIKREVQALDPNIPVGDISTVEDFVHNKLTLRRLTLHLLTAFAGIGLFIAAIGIYGVIAFSVSQRTQEIGIRMALGAQKQDVLRLVLRQGSWMIGIGSAIGIVATFVAGRAIESQLYNTSGQDPVALVGITVFFAGVAALACWLPARRATKVDPIVALRAE